MSGLTNDTAISVLDSPEVEVIDDSPPQSKTKKHRPHSPLHPELRHSPQYSHALSGAWDTATWRPSDATESDDSVVQASDNEAELTRKRAKNYRHKKRRTIRALLKKSKKLIKNRTRLKEEAVLLKSFYCTGPHNECQVIGTQKAYNLMNRFFNNFSLTAGTSLLQEIQKPDHPQTSNNGFIKILRFEKEGFNAYASLKCSLRETADNLAYEFRVGQFINSIMERFPCFVRTYGIYRLRSESAWSRLKDTTKAEVNPSIFFPMLQPFNIDDVNQWCISPKHIAVLTQHFQSTISMHEWLETASSTTIFENLVQIFYQVYFPLSVLHQVFTHYDLHPKNVLLYEIPGGRHVQFHYPGVSFPCRYIAKIIDYGRCFYYSSAEVMSQMDFRAVRDSEACKPNCGSNKGLGLLRPGCVNPPHYVHGISSDRPNESHDLRLLNNVLWQIFTHHDPQGRWKRHDTNMKGGRLEPLRSRLFTMTREIRFVNTFDGKKYPTAEAKKANEGLGTMQHLDCATAPPGVEYKVLPICTVQAAEDKLRKALHDFNHLLTSQRPLYATLTCNGTSPVKFKRV